MKYITVPKKVRLHKVLNDKKEHPEYGLTDWLEEVVWGNQGWRASLDAIEAFESLEEKLRGPWDEEKERHQELEPGTVVELSEKEFEIFEPIATLKGKDLPAHLTPVNHIIRAIMTASSKHPHKEQAEKKEKETSESV